MFERDDVGLHCVAGMGPTGACGSVQAMLDTFVPYSPDEFLNMPFEPEKLGDIPAVDEVRTA